MANPLIVNCEKPLNEFDEDDWAEVRFRNGIRMCMNQSEGMEPMRREDIEHLRAAAYGKGRKGKVKFEDRIPIYEPK